MRHIIKSANIQMVRCVISISLLAPFCTSGQSIKPLNEGDFLLLVVRGSAPDSFHHAVFHIEFHRHTSDTERASKLETLIKKGLKGEFLFSRTKRTGFVSIGNNSVKMYLILPTNNCFEEFGFVRTGFTFSRDKYQNYLTGTKG